MIPSREFSRLLWKEFRQVRALGIVLLASGVLLLFAVPVAPTDAPAIIMANVVAILFGVATSSTTFASEHENGTYVFQRALPTQIRFVAGAKLGVAIFGSLSIFLILWAVGLLAFRFGPAANWGELTASFLDGLMSLVEFLVFGTLLSLVERRSLVGLAKAVAMVLGIRWIGYVLDATTHGGLSNVPDFPWPSMSLRLVSVVVGIGLIVKLLGRWNTDEAIRLLPDAIGLTMRRELTELHPAEGVHPGVWRRLLWLQCRVSIWPIAVFTLAGISFATWLYQFDPDPIFYPPLATLLLGSIVFRAASRKREAIAALGTKPIPLWLSQLIYPAVACSLIVIAILFSEPYFKHYLPSDVSKQSYRITLFVAQATFAWGQLASLQCRGLLTAIGLSFGYSLLALFWIMLAVWGEARFWLFVLPVIVYPLVESSFRAQRWLSDGRQFRLWWLVRFGLYASLALGWMADRYYQIPAVREVEFNQALSATPQLNEQQANRLVEIFAQLAIREEFVPQEANDYDQVESAWKKNQRDWAARHRPILDEILSGSYLESLPGRRVGDVAVYFNRLAVLHEFLLAGLEFALQEEDVETAERIIRKIPMVVSPKDTLRWCKLSTNDSPRIRALARHFCDPLIIDEQCKRRIYGRGFVARFGPDWAPQPWWPMEFWSNASVGYPIAFTYYVVEGVNQNRLARYAAVHMARELGEFQRRSSRPDPPNVSPIPWIRQVVYGEINFSVKQIRDPADERFGFYVIANYTGVVAKLGGISLQLALIGWQMDHDGRLPDSLSELSPVYLAKTPLDVTGNICFAFLKDRVAVTTQPYPALLPASFQYSYAGHVRTLTLENPRKDVVQNVKIVDGRLPPLIAVLSRVVVLDSGVTPSEFAEKYLFQDGVNLFPIDWPAGTAPLPPNPN